MRRAASVLLACMLTGCQSLTHVQIGSDLAGAPPPGTAVTSGQVGVDARSGSVLGAIAAALALGVIVNRDNARSDSRSERLPMPSAAQPPAMAEGRDINAQDCTRPIERPSANLLCR